MLAKNTVTKEKWALKIMPKKTDNTKSEGFAMWKNEVSILRRLEHPHIIKLIDYSSDSELINKYGIPVDACFMALEYTPNGSLMDLITRYGKLAEHEARYYRYLSFDNWLKIRLLIFNNNLLL